MYSTDLADTGEDSLRILFFPDGTTEFARLYLEGHGGDRRRIELNGLTGVVTIVDPVREAIESGDEFAEDRYEDEGGYE